MEISSRNESRFGDALASGDGIAFQTDVNYGTININQWTRDIVVSKIVANAKFDTANKDAVSSYLPGTHIDVLPRLNVLQVKDIQLWIDGGKLNKIYWLNDMAGIGKPTIALTLARTYKRRVGAKDRQKYVRLGATFFSKVTRLSRTDRIHA
ncbi:uncharacterized protein N7469_006926 [Penicillium citrinum]|uniref:Uncharacterized protein n=1 Tax=Penicillium citrinum TaxID=5077 RepID=A0A9W9NVD7_PENCI|nr:uncharacterized protein N7469_006926 [Penicillium citrinum]KAJ5226920.1 hypothetical protein N7469_006926 [Penicillium citrinum]